MLVILAETHHQKARTIQMPSESKMLRRSYNSIYTAHDRKTGHLKLLYSWHPHTHICSRIPVFLFRGRPQETVVKQERDTLRANNGTEVMTLRGWRFRV